MLVQKKNDTKPQEQPNTLEQKLIGKWEVYKIGLNIKGKEIQRYLFFCQYTEFFCYKNKEENGNKD